MRVIALVDQSGCGQLSTDFLAHLEYKCIVPYHFRDKCMCLKTRIYGTCSGKQLIFLNLQ